MAALDCQRLLKMCVVITYLRLLLNDKEDECPTKLVQNWFVFHNGWESK